MVSTAIRASSEDTLPQLVTGSSYSRYWSMSRLTGCCPSLATNLEGILQLASPQLYSQAASTTQLTLQPSAGSSSARRGGGRQNKTITSLSSLQSVGNLWIPSFTCHMLNLKASSFQNSLSLRSSCKVPTSRGKGQKTRREETKLKIIFRKLQQQGF